MKARGFKYVEIIWQVTAEEIIPTYKLFRYQGNKHRNNMDFFYFLELNFIIKICENFHEKSVVGKQAK